MCVYFQFCVGIFINLLQKNEHFPVVSSSALALCIAIAGLIPH